MKGVFAIRTPCAGRMPLAAKKSSIDILVKEVDLQHDHLYCGHHWQPRRQEVEQSRGFLERLKIRHSLAKASTIRFSDKRIMLGNDDHGCH